MVREEDIIQTLHSLERAVLPVLKDGMTVREVEWKAKLKEVEVVRALQWLENKGAVKVSDEVEEVIGLGKNGKRYVQQGLPEKMVLKVLERPLAIAEVKKEAGLDGDELSISLGLLKARGAIVLGQKVERTSEGKALLSSGFEEELLLKKLPVRMSELSPQEKKIVRELKRRKELIEVKVEKIRSVMLTDLGRKLVKADMSEEYVGQLSPALLRGGAWKGKKLRRYDVEINVPRVYPAKRHMVNQAVQYIRRVWLELGFKEMSGPLLESSFWNFDALFVPQDHPAREMQDTFYIKGKADLPEKGVVARVKKAHESGVSGSAGWKYEWDPRKAMELVLRTHTTSLSARAIAHLKRDELPAKLFAVGRVFRNEALDWSHLFEFEQTEGIVVDEQVNFRHLLGYLKEFFGKMGFEKVRFRPGFFPYVEPGLECEVFHPVKKKWIELGGAGIFRPEVVVPLLGRDVPVLAWGLGMGRIIMDYWEMQDLRDLHRNDLDQLRMLRYYRR